MCIFEYFREKKRQQLIANDKKIDEYFKNWTRQEKFDLDKNYEALEKASKELGIHKYDILLRVKYGG